MTFEHWYRKENETVQCLIDPWVTANYDGKRSFRFRCDQQS
jgi:hypothetical protein